MNEILTYVITGCCGCYLVIVVFWVLFFIGATVDRKDNLHACPLCGRDCCCNMEDYQCWCNKCTHWNDVQE